MSLKPAPRPELIAPDPNESTWQRLQDMAVLQEYRFRSSVPLLGAAIAWIRDKWNGVAGRWYVRHAMEQQSRFNLALVETLRCQQEAIAQIKRVITDLDGDLRQMLRETDARYLARDHDLTLALRNLGETAVRISAVERELGATAARIEGEERAPRGE